MALPIVMLVEIRSLAKLLGRNFIDQTTRAHQIEVFELYGAQSIN